MSVLHRVCAESQGMYTTHITELHYMSTKQCYFKQNGIKYVDYKDIETMRRFLNPSARIMPAKRTGVCSKNQRMLALAIKRARYMGLIAYIES